MNREIENFLSSFPYAERTKEIYRRILGELVLLPELDQWDAASLIEFLQKPGWGNSQQNVAIFCVQKFLRWKYGALHPALGAKIKRIKSLPRRVLSPEKALQVLASFDPYKVGGARDLAIIAFGLDTGFRRHELCSLQLEHVDFYSNTALALCKGGQWGYGAFSPETAIILQAWLRFRKPADGVGNLFVSVKTGRGLTGDGMNCVFKRLTKSVGFKVSAHDLRSSFATLATIYGAPSRIGQEAGRWGSIQQFEHYTGSLRFEAIRPHLPMANLKKKNP
jgi:integrase